jgi:hypothetical protein
MADLALEATARLPWPTVDRRGSPMADLALEATGEAPMVSQAAVTGG